MNDTWNKKQERSARPDSSPLCLSARKKVRREVINNNNVTTLSRFLHEKNKHTNHTICHECDDPVECEYYYDWLVMKYKDDPSLLYVCKSKWLDVIHSEYRLLNNYMTYKKRLECGCVSKNYNTREWVELPSCLYKRIESFVDDEQRQQSLRWHQGMINKLSYSERVQKDFIDQTLDPEKRVEHFCKWVGTNRKPHAMN